MSTLNETFAAFRAAFERGETPDPTDYLAQVSGRDRLALDAMIENYLTYEAPTRPFDAEAFAEARRTPLMRRIADVAAEPELGWAGLLPALRQQAGLRRKELVSRLAAQIGLQGHETLVEEAYFEMESGLLSAETVKEPVLDALGKLLHTSVDALRRAGQAVVPGPTPDTAYGRSPREDRAMYRAAAGQAENDEDEGRTRVDELFRTPSK